MTLLVVVPATAAACGGSSSPSLVVGEASDRFPSDRLTDWVSYADQISVISVVSEEEIPPPKEVVARGEGYVERAVVLRVETTLWAREGRPSAEGTIRTSALGWVLDEGERRPFAIRGGPRLRVGARYLMPLVHFDARWLPLAIGATLPLAGDVVTTTGVVGDPSPVAEATKGASVDEIAAVLARTRPDPLAVKYAHLPPDDRWEAVSREQDETR